MANKPMSEDPKFREMVKESVKESNQKQAEIMKTSILAEQALESFDNDIYIPCQVVDGDMCWNHRRRAVFIEDSGGRRVSHYEIYPENECACGARNLRKQIKDWLKSQLQHIEEEAYERLEKEFVARSPLVLEPHLRQGYSLALRLFEEAKESLISQN